MYLKLQRHQGNLFINFDVIKTVIKSIENKIKNINIVDVEVENTSDCSYGILIHVQTDKLEQMANILTSIKRETQYSLDLITNVKADYLNILFC